MARNKPELVRCHCGMFPSLVTMQNKYLINCTNCPNDSLVISNSYEGAKLQWNRLQTALHEQMKSDRRVLENLTHGVVE